jgi:hypothetical protein
MDAANATLSRVEQIKKFAILTDPGGRADAADCDQLLPVRTIADDWPTDK